MEKQIEKFLKVRNFADDYGYGDGNGYGGGDGNGRGSGGGDGNGYGSGSGYGYGSGSGDGNGYGSGSGYGYGDGSGNGDGYDKAISAFNKEKVYIVDNIQTIIRKVHGNYAVGAMLNSDLTLTACYIARCGDYFAHGKTLREAQYDARKKYEQNMPVEERISLFNAQYHDNDTKIPAKELFEWHNTLTGSCLLGRKQFCRDRGIDVEHDSFTVSEFITITISSYGGDVIRQLKESRES